MNPSDAPDDVGALAESSYEFINTDDESQDGRNTEAETDSHSLGSFDYARPSDVHSLDGTERTDDDTTNHSDTDSENEEDAAEDRSRASSIQYAERSLLNPSSRVATPPLGHVDLADTSNNLTPLVRSIEFEETQDPVYFKQVSAKHAIHSFTEEESASIAQSLNFPGQTKRLIAAVRQTMAQSCLATKEPLRMMYTGNHAARHAILYKISSAYTASASPNEYDLSEDDGMYTVVPIGSAKDPQVELMKTSQYQIKVENCTDAKKIVYQGENFPGETVYSVTIDNDHTFQSAFAPSGSVVEPAWTLPHVAIFYVTETDDEATRKTREAAWGFMQRHAVPCIFISNTETFQQSTDDWGNMINQHAVHLCVESSDRAFQPVRLPIDLTSFLNIDARQMNRNLAYLTGLYETAEETQRSDDSNVCVQAAKIFRKARQYAVDMSEDVDPWTLAQTIGLSGIVIIAMLLSNWYLVGSSTPVPTVQTAASSAPVVPTTSTAVSTSTITINLTSTTTIRVPQAKTSQNNAVAPFAELADFIADKFPESPKSYVCSAERYSRNEILVKIPSSTKTSWLAKDSITIDVLKGDRAVKTKFSSIDEGILIEIPKKEAYGVLTIAVNTTRKPKVNETFYVDLGKTNAERVLGLGKSIGNHIMGLANNAAQRAEQSMVLGYLKNSAVEDMRELSARISTEAANTAKYVKDSWRPGTMANACQDMVQRQSHRAQDVLDWVERQHKSAQINSWLLLLKVQRKTEEYDTYLNKAKKYLANKKLVAEKASKERLDRQRNELRARRKKQRLEARCQSGFSRWTQQCKEQR